MWEEQGQVLADNYTEDIFRYDFQTIYRRQGSHHDIMVTHRISVRGIWENIVC